ncbi:MAG: nuclear transport factor 2 family protein [Bacteroidota bacterium]
MINPQPNMQAWTEAWEKQDEQAFMNLYSENALIIPPKKAAVSGNVNILSFMKGGMGKMEVYFEPDSLQIDQYLGFEKGTFKDVDPTSGELIGAGTYAISWILENKQWKILCHAWSIAE